MWNIQGCENRSLSKLQATERAFRRYSAEQRAGILVDGNGCRDRRDGDGVAGVAVVRGVFWKLDLCLGQNDFGGDASVGGRV